MRRVVQPELLDNLPPDAPEARVSRLDLRRVNGLLGHVGVLRRAVTRCLPTKTNQPLRVAELGAGDGDFTARLWTTLPAPRFGSRLWLLDQQATIEPAAVAALTARGWQVEAITDDAFEWLTEAGAGPAAQSARFDLIYVNLFAHHFDRGALRELLALIAPRTNAFVAAEPRRSRFALFGARLLRYVGVNRVTQHDAIASVRAGFTGRELTAAWPEHDGWELREGSAALFSHCFRARRITAS